MKLKFKINLTDSQKKAYNILKENDTRYLILCFSRQCGKSVLAEICLIEHLFKSKTFSAYISPTFAQGRKIYNEIIKLLDGKGIVKKSNGQTLTIETVFNSTLQFFSMESPVAIRGNTVSGILVIDEAAFIPDTLTDGSEPFSSVIMPITKARKPKTLVISTPKGKRGMFHDLYNKALGGLKGFKCMKATIYDDGLVTEEEIKQIKDVVNPTAFREEFLCEFLDSALTFFTGFENCFTKYNYNWNEKQWAGIDLSSVGEDDTIVTFVNESKQTIQYNIKGTLDQKYQKIADLINNCKNLQTVYIEQNGIGSVMINEIRKLVKNKQIIEEWTTTNDSKVRILSQLAVEISKKKIYFNEDNKQLFSQLSTFIYKYTKTGKLQLEAASSRHDDFVLSLAIALEAREKGIVAGDYNFKFGKKYGRK